MINENSKGEPMNKTAKKKSLWEEWKVADVVKPGTIGDFEVARFTLTEEMIAKDYHTHGGRSGIPGEHTSLRESGAIWMTDTRAEVCDHLDIADRMTGRVLIAGLGLGMITIRALRKPEVTHVDVIEINPEVIELVGNQVVSYFGADRVTIIEDDIKTWKPAKGAHYDVVWLDIWPSLCTDNLKEMGNLKRRFARCSDYRACWSQEEIAALARRQREGGFGF